MIWIACKHCGKRQGRADSLIGALVFCECGQGNRVPWQSTIAEAGPGEKGPATPVTASPTEAPARRLRGPRRPDPALCLNHEDSPCAAKCDDCGCPFCAACLVKLQGRALCGPCKNFRLAALGRPRRTSVLAILSVVVSFVAGPVAFFVSLIAVALTLRHDSGAGAFLLCLTAMALPGTGLVLGGMALRDIERRPHVGGRALAATGATTGLAGLLWAVTVSFLLVARHP